MNKRTYKSRVKDILASYGIEWTVIEEQDYSDAVRYHYIDWENPYQGASYAAVYKLYNVKQYSATCKDIIKHL